MQRLDMVQHINSEFISAFYPEEVSFTVMDLTGDATPEPVIRSKTGAVEREIYKRNLNSGLWNYQKSFDEMIQDQNNFYFYSFKDGSAKLLGFVKDYTPGLYGAAPRTLRVGYDKDRNILVESRFAMDSLLWYTFQEDYLVHTGGIGYYPSDNDPYDAHFVTKDINMEYMDQLRREHWAKGNYNYTTPSIKTGEELSHEEGIRLYNDFNARFIPFDLVPVTEENLNEKLQ